MAYTFLQLQDEVLNYGFDSNMYRARVKNWLNEGLRRVARKLKLPKSTIYSIPIVAGTAIYTLPTDLSRVEYVANMTTGGENKLFQLDKADYDALDQTNRAEPSEYFVIGTQGTGLQIGLWPTPDKVYTIRVGYRALPALMSADGDFANIGPLSTLENDYDDILINYALFRAYSAEDDAQMSQFHYGLYKQSLSELAADEQELVSDFPRVIPGTWGTRY